MKDNNSINLFENGRAFKKGFPLFKQYLEQQTNIKYYTNMKEPVFLKELRLRN